MGPVPSASSSKPSYRASLIPGHVPSLRLGVCAFGRTAVLVAAVVCCFLLAGASGSSCLAEGASTPAPPSLSSFYCTSQIKGAGSITCLARLAAASTSSVTVSLSSNNAAVTVPATVTVAENQTSASFSPSVKSVLTTQTATLGASVSGSSMSYAVQLDAATQTMVLNTSGLAFGFAALNAKATLPITVDSTGTEPITIKSATTTGAGFSVGSTFPMTLNSGQSATIDVLFDPAVAGAVTGQLTLTSTSTSQATNVVTLSGTGGPPTLSAFSCTSQIKGAGTLSCNLRLGAALLSGSVTVNLSSNDAALAVPATVTIPANQTTATFSATASSVLTTQTATLTASTAASSMTSAVQLDAATQTMVLNTTSLVFGYAALNAAATLPVTVESTGTEPITIKSAAITGAGFSVSNTFPITVNSGQSATIDVLFDPTVAGPVTGQLTLTSTSTSQATNVVSLSGAGGPPTLSAFSCTSQIKGAGTLSCNLRLAAALLSGSVTVNLSSNDAALAVPATVTIPANQTTATISATASSVLTTQTATLTASIGADSMTSAVQLDAATQTMVLNTSSLAFGYAALNASESLPITLESTGTEPITIKSAAITGAGFSVSNTFPMTVNSGQSATIDVLFDPAVAGAVTGQLTLTSTSTAQATNAISLSGTGGPPTITGFYCSPAGIKGAGTLTCVVVLGSMSVESGIAVSVSSNDAAASVPATVTVPAGKTSLQFPVNVASVLTTQTATLTAAVGASSMTFAEQLNAATQTLGASAAGLSFQDVVVDTAVTKLVVLTSTGTDPITLSAATLTGAGFTVSGLSLPLTLNPGQAVTVAVKYAPTAAGASAGQLAIATNSTAASPSVITLSGTGVLGPNGTGNPIVPFTYAGSSLLNSFVPPDPATPISPDFFGMTIYNLAPNSPDPEPGMTPFPSFPVSALRLWDVAYWLMLEPTANQYDWIKMDNSIAIAQENGVNDFIFTFGQVPPWAAQNPTDPCPNGEGPGTCSVPNMAALETFATQVVQRYCGKVKYYEPWNEPNNPAFWDGDNAQLLAVAQEVYQIAKNPANCGCTNGVCAPNGGVNPNKVLLPPIGDIGTANITWLNSYLASQGSTYPYADVATFHGYGFTNPDSFATGNEMQQFEQTLASYGLSGLPVWDTETSWEWDVSFTLEQQASWVMRYHMAQAEQGVSRVMWYAYDSCNWGTLWTSPYCTDTTQPANQVTEPGVAYQTLESWLIAANLTQCQEYQNGLWACGLQRSGGYYAWMLWSSTGTSLSVPVPANLGLTVYRDWQNNVNPLSTQITVTDLPVLLESSDL
jgi:hypothetical protein